MTGASKRFLCDELDFKIISELSKDARASAASIAASVNTTERTVRRRISNLVEAGIVRFEIYTDPALFGYVVGADIFVEVPPQRESETVDKLLERHEVVYIAYGQQRNEISLHAKFKDNEQLFEFIQVILPSFEGVEVKSYALVPRIVKMMHQWRPHEEDF